MTGVINRQNTSSVVVEVVALFTAVLISSMIAVSGNERIAFANKQEENKNGQKTSQSDVSIHYIICQTTGANSPIMDHSCSNQLTPTKVNSGVNKGYLPMKKIYGQKTSQSDVSIHYIICQTTGANSPIMDHSCSNQLTDGDVVPIIIPLVFG